MLILIKASKNINDLTGRGIEYLLDQSGEPIAAFSEGNFLIDSEEVRGNDEVTIKVAA